VDRNQASYVSPSDDIMSPCSKKLSDLKGKRFKKYGTRLSLNIIQFSLEDANRHACSAGKPQSLFAKLGKKNFEQNTAEHNNKSIGDDSTA
jgi:hypothetical protein